MIKKMTCTAHIGRKQAVGMGLEGTSGTLVAATDWMPKTTGVMTPVLTTINDTSGYGVIDEVYDVQTVMEHSETNLEGTLNDGSFGVLMKAGLGASTITGSGPYTHDFTVKNDNCHPSISVWSVDPVGTFASSYNMVQTLSITAEAENFATFSVDLVGKKMTTETEPTYSYASDNLFRARDVNLYFADTEVGLDTADAVKATNINLTIEKNLLVHQAIGSDDVDRIFNQQLNISGDFEAIYSANTYQDFVRDATKKYCKIEMINTGVTMSPSGNPTLSITLGKAAFLSREKTSDNNEIVRETVGFTAAYNVTDGYSIKAQMVNEKSTAY